MVDDGDAANLEYFIKHSDIERWSSWEEKKEQLIKQIPLLDDLVRAKRMVAALELALLAELERIQYGG